MGRSSFLMLAPLSFLILDAVFGLTIMPVRPSSLVVQPTSTSDLTLDKQRGNREDGLEGLAHNPARSHQEESFSHEIVVISKTNAEKRDESESVRLKILDYTHINITSNNSTKEHVFKEPTRPVEVISPSDEDSPENEIPCISCGGSSRQLQSSDNMDDDLESYFEFLERQWEDMERQGFDNREENVQKEGINPHNEGPPKCFLYVPDSSEPDFDDEGGPRGMAYGGPNMKRPAPDLR